MGKDVSPQLLYIQSDGRRNLTIGIYYFILDKKEKVDLKAFKHPPFSSTGSPDPQISQLTPLNFTPSQPRIAPLQRAT